LIQASTDMHLWADAYERDLNAVLDLQGKVATDIARRVNILVRPLEQTRSVKPEAYGLYLKGRYAFSQYTDDGWQQAIENYNKAIASDPPFAPAYSGLADAYLVAGAYSVIPNWMRNLPVLTMRWAQRMPGTTGTGPLLRRSSIERSN